jgi:hypothetical protein
MPIKRNTNGGSGTTIIGTTDYTQLVNKPCTPPAQIDEAVSKISNLVLPESGEVVTKTTLPVASDTSLGAIKAGSGITVDNTGLTNVKVNSGIKIDPTTKEVHLDKDNVDVTQLKNASMLAMGSFQGTFDNTATLSKFNNAQKSDFWLYNGTNNFSLGGHTWNNGDQIWCNTNVTGTPGNLTSNFSRVPNTVSQATTSSLGTVKLGNITPLADSSTPATGTSVGMAREDHVHPILSDATATASGKVPTPPNNTTTYLRGDATFATIPVMGASGSGHKSGLVPDTPTTSGTSKYLCEDGLWKSPSGTIAGSNGQIQFNDNGASGADSKLTWDNTNKRLGIGTATPTTELHIQSTKTTTPVEVDIRNKFVGQNGTANDYEISKINLGCEGFNASVSAKIPVGKWGDVFDLI